jgi:molybdate transport system substrate-binding protein
MIRPLLIPLALAALLSTPFRAVAQEAKPAAGPSLLCYSGPSMKTPMEELARAYEDRTGVHVDVEMSDPRSLIERIVVSKKADLFISHDPFLAVLDGQGVKVRRAWNVASLTPMIAVAKGNPRKIKGLEDLARPGLRVGLTDPRTAITGNIADYMLKKADVAEAVYANVVKRASAGRHLAKMLADDELDATFVWDAVVYAFRDKIESVEVRPDQRPRRGPDTVVDAPTLGRIELDHVRVTIAQLESSRHADAARAFAEFVASPEGAAVFTRNGFSPVDPDRPPLTPTAKPSKD